MGPAAGLLAALLAAPMAATPLPGAERPPCARCVALAGRPGEVLSLPEGLAGLDVLVRVEAGDEEQAARGIEDIVRKGGRPGLFIEGLGAPDLRAALAIDLVTVLLAPGPGAAAAGDDQLAFAVKTRLAEWRGLAARAALGVIGDRPVLAALESRGVAPYVDIVAGPDLGPEDAWGRIVWRTAEGIAPLTDLPGALAATRSGGARRWLWSLPTAVDEAARVSGTLAAASRWLTEDLVAHTGVDVRCEGTPAETFLHPETLATIALAGRCPSGSPVAVVPTEPGTGRLQIAADLALVHVPAPGAPDRFASGVQVVGARRLSVEEIVARHHAAAARQRATVRTLISTGTLSLAFEAPGFPAPVSITSETTIYAGNGRVELQQRRIRVNGIEFAGRGIPRLPIIEPERIASAPLAIALSDVYRYRLDGEELVDGARVYVVAFEPIDQTRPSFRGRAWIDAGSFALVRASAVQTRLRGPIVTSEQVDDYRETGAGAWLLARSDVRQTYEGAAHRSPIHRVLAIDAHEINPAGFESRRQAAYVSGAIMLRDTPAGFRYLQMPSPDRGESVRPASDATRAIAPPVAAGADRVRTLAAGVIIDPNISRPLPFAGLSYVDFNLLGTGTQLNAFFGGTYGQLAFSVPSVKGTRWQVAGRAFAIATSYHDRAFVAGREQYEENLRQRPAHVSVWVLRPLSPRISLRLGYDLDYTDLDAADTTAPSFVVPADQLVHGARIALEGQRSGWQGSVWWNPATRSTWREWGRRGTSEYDSAARDFQRFGLSVSRSAVLRPNLAGRVEGAAMAGTDLDRFSRYAFGGFDNRLRGYPSALIRYDRGAVVRGALAWSAARWLRLDGFVDSALVRDSGFGRGLRNYTGIGAAAEVPAPGGLLIAAEWGFGLRGRNADGSVGTHVVRISAFKLF